MTRNTNFSSCRAIRVDRRSPLCCWTRRKTKTTTNGWELQEARSTAVRIPPSVRSSADRIGVAGRPSTVPPKGLEPVLCTACTPPGTNPSGTAAPPPSASGTSPSSPGCPPFPVCSLWTSLARPIVNNIQTNTCI